MHVRYIEGKGIWCSKFLCISLFLYKSKCFELRHAVWCKRVILPAYLTDIRGRFQTAYTAMGVKASSAMGLKMGVFRFLPTTHAKTNAKQMSPRSSRTVRRFTRFHLHPKTAVDVGVLRTWRYGYFDYRKNPNTPYLSLMPG